MFFVFFLLKYLFTTGLCYVALLLCSPWLGSIIDHISYAITCTSKLYLLLLCLTSQVKCFTRPLVIFHMKGLMEMFEKGEAFHKTLKSNWTDGRISSLPGLVPTSMGIFRCSLATHKHIFRLLKPELLGRRLPG